MKKIILILYCCCIGCLPAAFAQQDETLKTMLEGKNRLDQILPVIENYYTSPATLRALGQVEVNRQLKHWKRWEWYMSSRLGPNGEFVNINQKMVEATGLQQKRNFTDNTGRTAGTGRSASGAWSLVGPNNTTQGIGRIDRLAFHPTDPDIVYAGSTAGGLWRTTNAGVTWSNLTPDISSPGISGIAIDPNNPNTIFILTGDGDSNIGNGGLVQGHGYMRLSIGVLRSTNGGTNWTQMAAFPGTTPSSLVGYRLTMDPTNPDILFACTNQGLFRTDNGGQSWGAVQTSGGRFYNMKIKPGNPLTCYAVANDGSTTRFYKSINGGIVWTTNTTINNQINNPTSRTELAVAASNSNIVYLLCGGIPDSGQFKGVFRSDDSGVSFDQQSSTPNILGGANDGSDNSGQSTYDLTIAVSNTTSATVVTGAVEVWRSLNSGVSWVYRGALHDDVHELGFHPVDNKLWAATDGGVYSSTDNGANWTSHFEGMSIAQFYRMAVSPADYIDMIAGAQDNGVKQRSGGTSFFNDISGSDGFTVGYDFADQSIYYGILNRSVTRFTNNGANTNSITPANSNNPFSQSLAVHSSLGNALFVGSDSVWRTTNGGASWSVSPNIQAGWFMRTCPSNGNRIYAAGGTAYNSSTGTLRRSDDGGVTWPVANILSDNTGFPVGFPKITCINVDPNNSNNVWVTFGGFTAGVKVYFSNDAGANWFNRSGTLPNVPVNCIAIDINNNAYAGTDNGVYYRGAGTSEWVPFYNNLPYVPVTELIISEADNRIRASTFGRGIWSSDLYSPCVADLNITGTLEGQEFYEASNTVTSTASLLTSEGSKVQMRGGNEVLLQAGFTARETTSFRAAIGPCGSGGVAGFRITTPDSLTLLPAKQYLAPAGGKKSMIHLHAVTNNEIQFEVTQKQNGEADILLTNETGAIIRSKNFAAAQTGTWRNALSVAGLTPGIYYLTVLLDKRVEHMQEVIIR